MGKPQVSPLRLPSSSSVSLPDVDTMERHGEDIVELLKKATDRAQRPKTHEASQPLVDALTDRFGDDLDEESRHELKRLLSMSVRLGWGFALVEEEQGLARPGYTDERIQTAIFRAHRAFPDGLASGVEFAMFLAVQAGHYVGRNGSDTIPSVMSNI